MMDKEIEIRLNKILRNQNRLYQVLWTLTSYILFSFTSRPEAEKRIRDLEVEQ